MNLFRIGNTVLNMDRINGILEHQVPTEPGAPAGRTVLRIVFDNAQIDLSDKDAQTFRRWYRHAARNLAPHTDEDGEALVSPEDQVRVAFETLLRLIDGARPRDPVMRHTAHRLAVIIDHFLTGELEPARATDFEKVFGEARIEAQSSPGVSPFGPSVPG